MSRYVTPFRIGLYTLALVYTEGQVPSSEIVSLLSFLVTHIISDVPKSDQSSSWQTDGDCNVADFEAALQSIPSVVTGRNVWDLFLKKLWSIDCLHALNQTLADSLSSITKSRQELQKERDEGLAPGPVGRISRTSPLGAFIRRLHLEYTRLHFADVATIWQDLIKWRRPTRAAFERKNIHDRRSSIDVNLSHLGFTSTHPITQIMYGDFDDETHSETTQQWTSHFDADRLMEIQVTELQRYGGRLPTEMRDKLRDLSTSGASMPTLGHYLQFLDSWRAGDHASAFDNLHRYFDYTVQNRDRTFYQYALLNLAILQADFGCHREAIAAMQEAISTAREKKDVTCLNFCMSWLYHFGKAFPAEMKRMGGNGIAGNETEALRFLKTKAKDSEMWSLMGSAFLSEAKLGLQNGECVAHAFELIAKAAHLNITKSIASMHGPTNLMRSSFYGRVGLHSLAWTACSTFIECYADEAAAEDILKCHCRMAHLLAQTGAYTQAHAQLDQIPTRILKVLKHQQYHAFFSRLLHLRQALHHNNLPAASSLLSTLLAQSPPDLELGFTLSLLEIDLLARQTRFVDAFDALDALDRDSHPDSTDVLGYIKLRLARARLLASTGHALQGFSMTVKAASIALRVRALLCLWDVCVHLGGVLLIELRAPRQALELLEAIVPMVLEGRDAFVAGRLFVGLADACVGIASQEGDGDGEPWLRRAVGYLDHGIGEYARVEDREGQLEGLAKKATVLKVLGDEEWADDAATRYMELKRLWEGEGLELE